MAWDDELLPEQRAAAGHVGTHARLLAGPGTGKTLTLTRRICYLIRDRGLAPDTIFAFTFTRAAAHELRRRIAAELGESENPRTSTLHSFALRQLIKNESKITDLPQPLRIADDWEEENVILPDLKMLLSLARKDLARDLVNRLSADWQSLRAEEPDWETRLIDPAFLGAWREHRQVYGYTLRAELVYQLKRTLELRGDFELESPIEHLLVDEYQDLNRCDLAIVNRITAKGAELYIAGDDDQSIYGFRKADPEGIRRFPTDYVGSTQLVLEICKRCDEAILDLGLFVASQDPRRINKPIAVESGRPKGEVEILRFNNQHAEAGGIAQICSTLLNQKGLKPDDILILLRSDRYHAFSRPIREALQAKNIDVAALGTENPLDEKSGRTFLAFLRLATAPEDSLAWRTLLQEWTSGVGEKAIGALYDLARDHGRFSKAIEAARVDNAIIPSQHRTRLSTAISTISSKLQEAFPSVATTEFSTEEDLMNALTTAASHIVSDETQRGLILAKLKQTMNVLSSYSCGELVRAIGASTEEADQDLERDKVNILTMHRAKGLTAEVVIIAAAEDQYIPGKAIGSEMEDERRLLYVSLTRARHHLFVTYCDNRTGQQMHTGRDSGKAARSLSQFLVDCPYTPKDGQTFASKYLSGAAP